MRGKQRGCAPPETEVLQCHCLSCHILIIRSDRRPETKQGIEGKIVRFRSGRVRDKVMDRIFFIILSLQDSELLCDVSCA